MQNSFDISKFPGITGTSLLFSTCHDGDCPLSRNRLNQPPEARESNTSKTKNTQQGRFFKIWFQWLCSIEFQVHTKFYITLWLPQITQEHDVFCIILYYFVSCNCASSSKSSHYRTSSKYKSLYGNVKFSSASFGRNCYFPCCLWTPWVDFNCFEAWGNPYNGLYREAAPERGTRLS